MLVDAPKALHRRHGVNLLNVGLVFVQRSIVYSLVNPKGPRGLQRDALSVLSVEVIHRLRRHFARGEGHDGGIILSDMFGYGHGPGPGPRFALHG